MKFSDAEMKKAAKNIRKNIKKGNGRPKKIKMTDVNGKTHKLSKKEYYGLFRQKNIFLLHNGRTPNTTSYVGKAKEPVIINYQDKSTTCGPASMNMCLQGLFDWKSESKLAKLFHTSPVSGTDPSEMIQAMKKLDYEVKVIHRNKKAVQKAFDKGYMVLMHIDTIRADCLDYRKDRNFGHFIACTRITKAGNYRIFDPTKGIISCKPSVIDNAMYGREINYYSVKPL